MMAAITFESAKPADAKLLTETSFTSKRMWNYTDAQMRLWTDDLTITTSYIKENKVFKIFHSKVYTGFFSLVVQDKWIEIDHFWLLPAHTGKGYGSSAFAFIKNAARQWNCRVLKVCADPYAEGFYIKMGGEVIHRKESKIKGRLLTVYAFYI